MQNKKVLVLTILSIGAVISLIYGMTARPRYKGSTSRTQEMKSETPVPTQPRKRIIPIKRRAAKTKHETWGRDPFTLKKGVSGLVLDGIMWNEKNPRAMVSGELVRKGDKIGDKTVMDVQRDKVILNDGKVDTVLRLNE